MSDPPKSSNSPSILGGIASIVGLLGIALYFTGWVYRLAYYGFFQLEVTTLNFPVESFLLVPIQVLFGNVGAIVKTAIAILLALLIIHLSLWLLEVLGNAISSQLPQRGTALQSSRKLNWRSFINFSLAKFNSLRFGRSLFNEAVIVFWVLLTLFILAFSQGLDDAKRDAFNNTSTRPVIAFITPEKRLILGRNLKDRLDKNQLAEDPAIEGYAIIGDVELFKKLRAEDTNDAKKGRVWRLLIEREDWIYLFATLPENADPDEKSAVIAIEKGSPGDRLMILSPVTLEVD